MAHKILVVGADLGTLQDVLPMFKRAEFTVVHVGRCRDGVAAVRTENFAVVIVQPPVADPNLGDLVAALRSPESASSSSRSPKTAANGWRRFSPISDLPRVANAAPPRACINRVEYHFWNPCISFSVGREE